MAAAIQNALADMARADGLHDFGSLGPKKDARDPAFATSVVGTSANEWDENTVMDVAFGRKAARELWEALADGGATPESHRVIAQGKSYYIKRVKFEGKTGAQLVEGLGIDGAVLQVDFNHHGFLARLKEGPARAELKVGYIWSAATVNDPASKTPPNDPIFKPGGGGVELTAYQQTSGDTIFPGNKPFNVGVPAHNFVTAYDVTLSGIQSKTSFGRRATPSVNIKFTSGARSVVISDSKGQNSPAQLNSFITKLLAKLGNPQAQFDLSTKWMQKRSGDWLQVLHAAMLPLMTFEPALPAAAVPFFVSHDRIAIAYALAMGVNCLYFTGDSVIAFNKTPDDPATRAARCSPLLARIEPRRSELETFVNLLYENHKTALDTHTQSLNTQIEALKVKAAATLGDIEKDLQSILTTALEYVFIETLFPDKPTLVAGLTSADVCTKYAALARLESLFAQHAGQPNIPSALYAQFKRTMVYKAAKDWAIEPSTMSRLTVFPGHDDERDAFLFFPFLQSSKNAKMKEDLAAMFRALQSKMSDAQLDAWGAKTPSRKTRVRVGLSNLFEQGYIFLKTTPVPDAAVAGDTKAFRAAVSGPDTMPAEGDKPSFINRLKAAFVVISQQFKQSASDIPLDEAKGGSQTGGWDAAGRPQTTIGIGSYQCTHPILYAFVDYAASKLESSSAAAALAEAEAAGEDRPLAVSLDGEGGPLPQGVKRGREKGVGGPPLKKGGRRPLYGGQTQVMTEAVAITDASSDANDVMLLLLPALARLQTDLWKLEGAPPHLLEDYTRIVQLLKNIASLPATPENALAVRDLLSHAVFMDDQDIADVFGVSPYDARKLRLFLSALEESQPMVRPASPAEYLRRAKTVFGPLYPPAASMPVETLRIEVDTLINTIVAPYTGKSFPGAGQVLSPGAPVLTGKEAQEARITALTRKAGARHRRTYRKKRTTTP